MTTFESEDYLLATIAQHDALIRQCVAGELSFSEFCEKYNDFYAYWALDGHECDEEERILLDKHNRLIEPHRVIAYEILGKLCSDEDAKLDSYIKAGRFGSVEAMKKLANVRIGA